MPQELLAMAPGMRISVLTLLLASTFSLSDDCSIGTEGGNVFIEYDKDIEMSKEEIIVNMFRDSAIVQCKFWFYNSSEAKEKTVGFPNWWSSPPSASTEIRNFKTWVNGKEIEVHSKLQSIVEVDGKDTLPDEDKEWFVWETKFGGKDTTLIENRYTAEFSRCNCTREKSFAYVLGTGRTWKNSIGSGKIIFNFDNSISELWFREPSLPIPKKKMKTKKKNGRLEIEFQEYEPQPNDHVGLNFFSPWEAICSFQNDSAFSGFLLGRSKKQLKEMRNEVFARHGYVFGDKDMSILFSEKPWHKPNKEFKAAMIPKSEGATIAEIKRIEDQK